MSDNQQDFSDNQQKFHAKISSKWIETIHDVIGPSKPSSITWNTCASIISALKPFMGPNFGHGHYPVGGGMDFMDVVASNEPDCIEIHLSERSIDVMKPRSLTLEYIEQAPAESFLFLELDELPLVKIDDNTDEYAEAKGCQYLIELRPGEYEARSVWDRGFLGHDEYGKEIPLPQDTRLVSRWLRGKVLLVVKSSLWNASPSTYTGIHNKTSSTVIRAAIEKALNQHG